jgi:hypothetical protein
MVSKQIFIFMTRRSLIATDLKEQSPLHVVPLPLEEEECVSDSATIHETI